MDTNLLKIFLTYSQTENLRMTADFHNTSHVAIIRALRSLEDITCVKLTTRIGRGSRLTNEGKKLVRYAEKFLAEEKNFLKATKHEIENELEFKIATFEVFSTHLAPEINLALGLDKKISWLESTPGEIEYLIRSGKADLGITYIPIPTNDVEHLMVNSISMGVYQGQAPLFIETLESKIPFAIPVQPNYDTPTKAKGLDGWPDHKISRNIKYRVTLMETALALTAAGQCVGYFPDFVVKKYNEDKGKPLKKISTFKLKEPLQEIFIVKRKNEEEFSTIKKVTKVLRSLR